MALLTTQQVAITGTTITYAAATGGGDTFALNPRAEFRVKNGSGASITVTLVVPGNNADGLANPDPTYVVPAGAEWAIGPFASRHVDPTLGTIGVTYSGVTSLTVAYVAT